MINNYINKDSKQFFAFNIWSTESAKAVIDGCSEFGNDALLQTSMKAYNNIDKKQLISFIKSYAKEKNINAYVHLDHCKNLDILKDAIKNGWDSVMIDGSEKNLEENINITLEAAKIAHDNGISIEAEIGQINGNNGIADINDVKSFIEATNLEMLAVGIGTSHGLYKGTPVLSYDLLEKVISITDIPLVIHGGTGLSCDTFKKLLSYNQVKKINISTDIKMSYRNAFLICEKEGLFEQKGFDPIIITQKINESIKNTVIEKQKLL